MKFIQSISDRTPLCVVKFASMLFKISIEDRHWGVQEYINRFLEIMADKNFIIDEYPTDSKELLSKCVRLLNPFDEDPWCEKSIDEGMSGILPYFEDTFVPPTRDEVEKCGFGPKTNQFPFRINDVMAYRICCHFGYEMDKNTTAEEMANACRLLLDNEQMAGARRFMIENIKVLPAATIAKFSYTCSKINSSDEAPIPDSASIREQVYDDKSISRVSQMVESITFLTQRMTPENNIEAVVMAHVRFSICISDARNPMEQYNSIVKRRFTSRSIHKYIPINDAEFAIKYRRNPEWFRTDLNWFVDLLPSYNTRQLVDFAHREGYVEHRSKPNDKILMSFLTDRHKINNFYFGRNPYCNKNMTYYLENIDDVPDDELISFGSLTNIAEKYDVSAESTEIRMRKMPENNLEYLTVEELTDYFRSTKIFIDILSKKSMDANAIIKLRRHTEQMINSNSPSRKKYIALREQLNELEEAKQLIDRKVRELFVKIKELPIAVRQQVNLFLDNCIYMAMYMRGWKINGMNEFPLKSSQTMFDKSLYQCEVFDNTFVAWHGVMDAFAELPKDIQDDIQMLNLITFSTVGDTIQVFDQTLKGIIISRELTLMKCIDDCIHGDDTKESSCIRTNSNWILFTVGWYSLMFGFDQKFKLNEIEEIR